MKQQDGVGFGTGILIFIIIVCIIMGLLFYFKVFSFDRVKTDISNKLKIYNNDSVIITAPPIEFDWCRVQELPDSKIIGWDNEEKCCVREWNGLDYCLQKNISVHTCFIGTVGTIYKWSKVNGYFTDLPRDYQEFIKVIDIDIPDNNICVNLDYPSVNDQSLNIDNNYELV